MPAKGVIVPAGPVVNAAGGIGPATFQTDGELLVQGCRFDPPADDPRRIALFVASMRCGGAERMMLNLAAGLVRARINVDLVLAQARGPLLGEVPDGVRIVDLGAARVRRSLRRLAGYLREARPDALISRVLHCNLAAILARRLARSRTRIAVVEASHLGGQIEQRKVGPLTRAVLRLLYPRADVIVAPSRQVACDLEDRLRLTAGSVRVIPNPVVDASLLVKAAQPPDHPWLRHSGGPPVILGVGRLEPVKRFDCLIEAFARLRRTRDARLLLLGEGTQRPALEHLARRLGVAADVQLAGYVANPYGYMSRAAVLVQTSTYEGLPNVLIEALACGCPVVATDAPGGAAEILEDGRYGQLVPVGNPIAVCEATCRVLDTPPDRDALCQRGQSYGVARAVQAFLAAVAPVDEAHPGRPPSPHVPGPPGTHDPASASRRHPDARTQEVPPWRRD